MGKGGIIGYITNSLGYFKMGCKNRYKPINGQGFCLSCQTNNVQIKKLIALHGCKGEEEPEASTCEATFVTAVETKNREYTYSVTYSLNGGPQISFYDEDYYFVIDKLTLHPIIKGKVIFILYPDNIPSRDIPPGLSTLAGFTHDGFIAGDLGKLNLLAESELVFDNGYFGPFSFSPEVNTLEIFPTLDVRDKDLYDYFGGASLNGAPLVVKSCSTLSLGKADMQV